jgi:hypothetical protein
MSGLPFPTSLTVEVAGKSYKGCGSEPETLLRGDWAVERINAAPTVGGSTPSLSFAEHGQ